MSKRYTPAQRAEAQAAYEEHGPREAERITGIPHGTITKWAKRYGWEPRFLETANANVKATHLEWAQRRADMTHHIGAVADKALTRVETLLDGGKDHNAKEAATTMAILVDKAQLLSGSPTSRQHLQADRDRALSEAREKAPHLRVAS